MSPRRPRRHRETADYHAMMVRMVQSYGRRVSAAKNVEELAALVALRAELDRVIDDSARSLHDPVGDDPGISWTVIGAVLGITRQSARERFTRSA